MRLIRFLRFTVPLCAAACSATVPAATPGGGEGAPALTVVAIGETGEVNGVLRGCGAYITNMHTGQHDAGKFDLMFFLGDNFTPTGLNIGVDDVRKTVDGMLEPFRATMDDLGRGRCHAIAGEHDYYARNAIEGKLLLGLVHIEEAPVGLSDRGNRREAAIGAWTYHYGLPEEATVPLAPGAADSVQFIFFDSAIPLRTQPEAWSPALRALRGILASDRARPQILWRVFCAHHPFMSAGEHAGYTAWDDEAGAVEHVPPCDRDSSAFTWFLNSLDPEDLCAGRYRAWTDSVRAAVRGEGVKVQFALAAHDHSLQLIAAPGGGGDDPFPALQIISGAGSTPARVSSPSPPFVYTAAQTDPSEKGESLPGFVRMAFDRDACTVVFYSGNNGDPIDMGGGTKSFRISPAGSLIRN